MCEERYRGNHTQRVSKLVPSSESGIGMADWTPQSKTLQSLEEGHIY